MAVTTVQLPNGNTLDVEHPEGASQQQILKFAKQQYDGGALGISRTVSGDQPDDQLGAVPEDSTLGAQLRGAGEVAETLGRGAIAAPIAGLEGIGAAITPGGRTGGEAVRERQAAITGAPETQEGQQQLAALTDAARTMDSPSLSLLTRMITGAPFSDIGPVVSEAMGGSMGENIGREIFDRTQSPLLAAIGETLPVAAGTIGPGSIAKQGQNLATQSKIAQQIQKNPTNKTLVQYMRVGKDRVAKDKQALEAIRQGFDEGVIAATKGASADDRLAMQRMAAIAKRAKEDARYGAQNRPTDIVGQNVTKRVGHIVKVNRQAGKDLNQAAKSLKGQEVDFSPAIDKFAQNLDEMGVTLEQTPKGIRPNFQGSDIEGAKGAEQAIKNLVKRMESGQRGASPDAYDVHRMKKFIDEQVTFGKNKEGLGGNAERVMKELRRDLDEVLDQNFPEYDAANSLYSETINALDMLQDAAGRKMNLQGPNADKAVGTLMRRLLSNVQSRVNLVDAIDELNDVAKNTGGQFNDDILTQIMFADELDRRFGVAARSSLAGEVAKATKEGANVMSGRKGMGEAAIDAAADLAERARGINDENAFRVINDLLRR